MTTSTINLLTDGNFDGVSLAPDAQDYNQGSPDGAYNGLVPFGWTGTTGDVGTFAPTAVTSPGFSGSQVAYLNQNGAISQTFATPDVSEAGFDQYVVSLDVGIRLQGAPTSGSVTVTAKVASTVIGSTSVSVASLTSGAATPLSFTTEDLYTAGLAGQPITLTISNGANGQVLVGNVSVTSPNLISDGNFNEVNLSTSTTNGPVFGNAAGNFTETAPPDWSIIQGSGGLFAPTMVASHSDIANPPGFAGSDVAYLTGTNASGPTTLTQTFATPTVASGPERIAISLEVGTRTDAVPTSGTVTVTAKVGSTIVGETTFNPVAATPGEAYTVQFTTDDLAALGLAGQNVTLSITNDANNQVLVGDVNAAVVTAPPPPVTTLTFDVSTEAELNSVIQAINVGGADAAGNGVYQINITGPITLSGQITALHLSYGASVTIAGTTSGAGAAQVETINGQNAYQGFFAYSGNITLQDLNIDNTVAQGGNGGANAGGGAGLGGGLFVSGSTGGGGSASVTLKNVNFSGDAAQGGNGGVGTSQGSGGNLDSGVFVLGPGQYGGGGSFEHVGGFGGGGGRGVQGSPNTGGGSGFAGGFGGGGGAGGFNQEVGTSHGITFVPIDLGGSVFGGGESGLGVGGGGLGAGGDIFVQQGGSLTIEGDALGGGSLGAGSVAGGAAGGSFAHSGAALGDGMFLSGNQSFTLAPLSGQTLTVAGVVADMAGSGSSGQGQLIIDGPGTVTLSAANTYQGGTVVKEGTLSIFTTSNIGGGTLTLENGTAVDLTAGFTLYNTIIVSGDPTFDVPTGQTNVLGSYISDGTSPGDVVLTGGGTLALTNGSNSYSGGTTIEGGSTLELSAAGAAGSGAIRFSGTGNTLKIDGTTMPSNTIDMTPGNTIDLAGIAYDSAHGTAILVGSQLQVTENGHTYDLNPSGIPAGEYFHLGSDNSGAFSGLGGTDITENTTPCYCRGTLIRTPEGERRVEELRIGDRVVTVSGRPKPIKWIGRRSYDGRFIRGRRDVLPVVIAAGALRRGVPARDLWVSPEHALYLDEVLVPARFLVNGMTVTQPEAVDQVEYFHLEFEGHEIILAEGAAAESYVESHNRRSFHNADEFYALYPDDDRPSFAECASRVTPDTPVLAAIRQRLFDRAEVLGFPTTDDPDLHLIADGEIVRPSSVENDRYAFVLARKPGEIWLASRSAVPAELELQSTDTRRLGVCIEKIIVRDDRLRLEISRVHPLLREGFHDDEGLRRWTDGMALLPESLFDPFAGTLTIDAHCLDAKLRYPRRAAAVQAPDKAARATELPDRTIVRA